MSERELAVLWRMRGYTDQLVICRAIETAEGLELRIERDGEVHLSETYADHKSLFDRSSELYAVLCEKGWRVDPS